MIYQSCVFIITIIPPTPPVPQLTFPSFVPNKKSAFIHSFIAIIIVQSSHPSSLLPPTFIEKRRE